MFHHVSGESSPPCIFFWIILAHVIGVGNKHQFGIIYRVMSWVIQSKAPGELVPKKERRSSKGKTLSRLFRYRIMLALYTSLLERLTVECWLPCGFKKMCCNNSPSKRVDVTHKDRDNEGHDVVELAHRRNQIAQISMSWFPVIFAV